jgi:hypothetical protein
VGVKRTVLRSQSRMISPDPARLRRALSPPQRNFLNWGKVGYREGTTDIPEPTTKFVRIENGQVLVECTVEPGGDKIVARLGLTGAGDGFGDYIPLEFGCRVVIEYIKGNPANAVITAALHDGRCSMPDDVSGVQTGAATAKGRGVSVAAPMWRFIKMGAGQLLAIETQANGDMLFHSAGSVEIKSGSSPAQAIHLNGATHLGVGPLTPPVGARVGPAGVTVPGVPAVAHIPIPKLPTVPVVPPKIAPFIGNDDSIIRAKDMVQSHILVDPVFWAWIAAAGTALASIGVLVPIPLSLHCEHSGAAGKGSKHTASD